MIKIEKIEEHCWILVGWVVAYLVLISFVFPGSFGFKSIGYEGINDPKCLGKESWNFRESRD